MSHLPKKGKKRKLKNPLLLNQCGGYRVKNLAKTFLVECFHIVYMKFHLFWGQFLHENLAMPFQEDPLY